MSRLLRFGTDQAASPVVQPTCLLCSFVILDCLTSGHANDGKSGKRRIFEAGVGLRSHLNLASNSLHPDFIGQKTLEGKLGTSSICQRGKGTEVEVGSADSAAWDQSTHVQAGAAEPGPRRFHHAHAVPKLNVGPIASMLHWRGHYPSWKLNVKCS